MTTQKERFRFAPSPTGYLHIGGVRTALFNWLWARKSGGAFVLRIEDTDQERSTEASRRVILDSMRWLAMDWDEGPEAGGEYGPYTQMERLGLYREHAEVLIAKKKAYRCTCTKEQLDEARAALKAKDHKASFRYPGTCREANHPRESVHVVRFATDTAGETTYTDMVFGEVKTPNSAQQDFVLLRSDGVPLYNFGAVVDDLTMKISLVARGRDHMVNTPPQLMLYEAFGAEPPRFAHLPMMLAPSGEKLSKRHGAVSVAEYESAGYSPNALLNYLVRFGWSHGDKEVFSCEEMIAAFDWEHCNKSDGKFDTKKLLAINHEHLKSEALTETAEYARHAGRFLRARAIEVDDDTLTGAIPFIRDRAKTYVEAADWLEPFFRTEVVVEEKAKRLLVKAAVPVLTDVTSFVETLAAWPKQGIGAAQKVVHEALEAWLVGRGLQLKDVAQVARVALTGRTVSPGLDQTIAILGRDESIERLRKATILAGAASSGA